MRIVHPALALIPLALACAADSSLQATLARMDAAAAKYKGMKANISRVVHLSAIKETDTENGTVAARRVTAKDLRMLVTFGPPNPKKVLLVQAKAEIYYPKINTVQEFEFGKAGGLKDQLLMLTFGSTSKDLLNSYQVTGGIAETVAGQKTTRLDLVPKDKQLFAQYPKIQLWVSDETGVAVQQKLIENSGDYNLATYTAIELGNVTDADVRMDVPKDAVRGKTIETMNRTKTGSYRLQYLDWLRGLGAVIMLQGHVFDSFLKNDLRQGGPFLLSQFIGGMPPAIFLFLTGVTLAFLMDSSERKGLGPRERIFAAFRRSGYLFLLAFLFRFQLWLFARPVSPWTDLFKVDILNCMGLAIAVVSLMAAFTTAERVKLCAVLGLAIACSAPLISQMDWSGVPWMLRSYVMPDYSTFAFFPWAAFLAFGVSAGSLIRVVPQESLERVMQWGAIAGGATIMLCQYFASLDISLYSKSEYWLNSPALILTKLGVVLLLLATAFVWTRFGAGEGWSWVRQLGTTSLIVYWVHIELVYGRWFWYFKNNLMLWETVVFAICLIVAMLALSALQTERGRILAAISSMRWRLNPRTGGAEGD